MKFIVPKPSAAYLRALEESRQHHRVAKTWNGSLMSRHIGNIKALIDRLDCRSGMDYGAGKCTQYLHPLADGRTVEQLFGFEVFKVDPAVPDDFRRPPGMPTGYKIATELPPQTTWDIVIVTHVLGSIPLVDLKGWVVPMLHQRANRAIYFAENLNKPKKDTLFSTTADKPREWAADQWMRLMTLPGSDVVVEGWFRGEPGNNPRESGDSGGAEFRKWPF